MFDHRGVNNLDRLSFAIYSAGMINLRVRKCTEVSCLRVLDRMVLILLGDLAVFIQLNGCSGPVYYILSGRLIIDEFRSPCTSRVLRRDLRDPRLAPVYKVVGLPYHDTVASASACALGTFWSLIGARVRFWSTVMWGYRLNCWNTMEEYFLAISPRFL